MKRKIFILMWAMTLITIAAPASTFATMSVEEISELLASATVESRAASAKDAANGIRAVEPVTLSAEDMVMKVYGVVPTCVSKQECSEQCIALLGIVPEEDSDGLWLDSDSGYAINYYGMQPEVTALASFGADDPDDASLTDFGYFFLFPYTSASKAEAVKAQADFCGNLLQEMADTGMDLGVNEASTDLFEVIGSYNGNDLDVRLLDDRNDAGSGRYILVVSVEPGEHLATSEP